MVRELNSVGAISQAFSELEGLASAEYGLTLSDILKEAAVGEELALLRFNRLLGVMLKEPFSDPYPIPPQHTKTHAARGWRCVPEKMESDKAASSWQFAFIEAYLRVEEPNRPRSREGITSFVSDAAGESVLSVYVLKAIEKYLCGNAEAKEKVKKALEEAQKQGVELVSPMPENLIPAAGLGVCAIVTASIPFGPALGPLAGGITILLLNIGLESFCEWTKDKVWNLRGEELDEKKVVADHR